MESRKKSRAAVIHIPLPEAVVLWNEGAPRGSRGEKVSCPFADLGHSAQALMAAGVSSVYSGHDHLNDFYGLTLGGSTGAAWRFAELLRSAARRLLPLGGGEAPAAPASRLRVAYGKKSGYGGYGYGETPDGPRSGARVVVLREGDADTAGARTWIRLDDGSKEEQRHAKQRPQQLSCI